MIPKLRLREFYNAAGYTVYDFSDLFEFSSGKNIKQNEASKEFKTPCVRYGELYHMYSEVIDDVINRTNLESVELRFSLGDEILLPSAGEDPLGIGSASALTLPNIAIGRTINVLRPKQENTYSHIYVAYYINEKLKKKIASLAKGVSISNVYNSDLRTLQAVLPSVAEQNKVASFMRKIDTKINLLTKKKEALETYKKGLMQKIFSQELRFKREDGTYYPKWKKVTLGSTCKVLRGKGLPKSVISKDGLYKCIHYGELFTYYGEVIAFVNSFTDNRDGTLSQFGDVLMPSSDVTPYGLMTASMVQEDNVYLGGDINVVRPNQTIDCEVYSWDSAFLSFYLNSIPKVLMRLISGTTVKHLYTSDLKGVELWQPTKKEQEICSRLFLSINSKIEILEKELFAIHNLKKGLLQQMFV